MRLKRENKIARDERKGRRTREYTVTKAKDQKRGLFDA